jgi:hypothetical protein
MTPEPLQAEPPVHRVFSTAMLILTVIACAWGSMGFPGLLP